MSSSSTRLPNISTRLRPRSKKPAPDPEQVAETEEPEPDTFQPTTKFREKLLEFRAQRNAQELASFDYRLPVFLNAPPDPYTAFTSQFDLYQLFSTRILTFANSDVQDKKKSLRKVTVINDAEANEENLSKEAVASILGEVKRIMKHSLECVDTFLSFFYRVTKVDRHLLGYLSGIVPKFSVDRTVATHPRLISLRLFDTSYLIELGQLTARSVCLVQSLQMRQRRIAAEERFKGLLQVAGAQLSRMPFSAEAFRTAMPTGWQLHPDTNTPLSEREIEEQNNRIKGDFTFLCFGLLVALGFSKTAEDAVVALLYESAL
jgi:hypothetical protein